MNPHPRSRRRLSPERQALVVRYIPLARRLALPWKDRWPHAWEEFESAALLALVQAAVSFEPDRNVKFATYARHRIGGALRDARRALIPPSRLADVPDPQVDHHPDIIEQDGRVVGIEPDPPVGWEIDTIDAVDGWLGKLPPKHAAACRQIYILGKSQLEAAQAIGLSQSRLCSMHRDALQMLGKPRTPGTDGASAPRPGSHAL
ncbi:MAG TPA: sigma-70 family RNA polymerase sigma factor [Isosphaeraceae bacterium]|nr:sigma-70 family RNA polymerase sigma factor [Isosphaeraceae bacterium]